MFVQNILREVFPDKNEIISDNDGFLNSDQSRKTMIMIFDTIGRKRVFLALILRYAYGMTYKEAGYSMGVKQSRIMQLCAYGIRLLKHPTRSTRMGKYFFMSEEDDRSKLLREIKAVSASCRKRINQ